uniref:INCENP_ARK-bind domain-containing protein n=1 Tax=Meloidogyne incognita TaxID=6306 RepID=A0A914KQI0_MELIC
MPAIRKSKKVKTTSKQYETRSFSKKRSKTIEIIEDDVDTKKIEDLKLVASFINWSNYEKMLGRIFYDKVGKILEQKVDEFQKIKTELKTFIRENYDNQKALQTPKRAKPATALLEQISKFKQLNFDSDDEYLEDTTLLDQPEQLKENEEEQLEKEPPADPTVDGSIFEEEHPVEEKEMEEPPQAQMEEEPPNEPEPSVEQEKEVLEEKMEEVPPQEQMEEEPPNEPELSVEQEDKSILFVPETPVASRVPIDAQSGGVFSTPVTPCSPKPKKLKMLGTPNGIVGSMRKLAITNGLVKSAQQTIQMPPILRLTPNAVATPIKIQSKFPTKIPVKTPVAIDKTLQKVHKLKQIDEKADQAKRAREDLLREKADRAKREREERAKRVEQNNKKKEEARLERENNVRKHLEAVKEFQNKEIQNNFASPNMPVRILQPLSVLSKTTNKTPIMKVIPASKVKSKEAHQLQNCVDNKSTQTSIRHLISEEECPLQIKTTTTSVLIVQESYLEEKENAKIVEDENLGSNFQEGCVNEESMNELEQISVYDMTKEKIFLPSTETNYIVDDLSSGDETDNDEQPRKIVPKWALKENILERTQKIHHLITKDQIEHHFGKIRQPTIQDLFGGYCKDYPPRRASSAVWNSPMSDPTPGIGLYQSKFATATNVKVHPKKR